MTDKQKIERLTEIEEEAITRYLDRTNFDRTEWMTDDEKAEYLRLYREVNGECLECGETAENCTCKD